VPLTERNTRPSSRTSRNNRSPDASTPAWTVKLWWCTWRDPRGFRSMSLPCCNQHHHKLNSWCQTLTGIRCQIQLLTQEYSISLNYKPTNPTLTLLFISHVLTFQETFSYHNCVYVSCFSQFSLVESKVCHVHGNRFLPNYWSGPAVHSPPGCTPVLYDFCLKVAAPCASAPSCLHSSSPLSPPDYTA